MIFTIGITENYDRYIVDFFPLEKAMGGSVWSSYADAQAFCLPNQSVYGILADWEKDTQPNKEGGPWNDLLIEARIVPVKLDNYGVCWVVRIA